MESAGLYDIEETERAEVLKHLSRLSLNEVVKLAQLTPENMKRLFDLMKKQTKVKEKRNLLSKKTVQEIEGATARIQEMRKKLKEKRKEAR